MLADTFSRRFAELEQKYNALPWVASQLGSRFRDSPSGPWQQWGTSAQSLIRAVYGESSPHYRNFEDAIKGCDGSEHELKKAHGIFSSAKEDFEGGYVFNVELLVSGEVFGDFVLIARQCLAEGHKDVAAVVACAALEDTLKRYAIANGLDVADKVMQEVVNALKAKGLVLGAQKSLLDAMPKIRDYAMHANWDKISEPDVSSVIGFVEQFLLSNFSRA